LTDPAAVGRELEMNGRKLVIVGIMAEFAGLDDLPRDVWVPVTMYGVVAGQDPFG